MWPLIVSFIRAYFLFRFTIMQNQLTVHPHPQTRMLNAICTEFYIVQVISECSAVKDAADYHNLTYVTRTEVLLKI